MDTSGVLLLACLLVSLGITLIYTTVTQPAKRRRAQILDPRREVKVAKSVPGGSSLAAMAMDLGDTVAALMGMTNPDDETNVRGQAVLQLLKAADWYWEMSAVSKPTPDAPFWSLGTYWSAKGFYMLVYGAVGLLVLLVVGLGIGAPWLAFIGGGVGAFLGFIEPDDRLSKAARIRQDAMTIELGFAVPKLHALFRTRGQIEGAVRELCRESGGPFIEELQRVLAVNDVVRNFAEGLRQMIDRNTNQGVRDFATAMIQAVERKGGDMAHALSILSEQARDEMIRYVEQRSLGNMRSAGGQVSMYMMALITLGVIVPIALVVAASLAGGGM